MNEEFLRAALVVCAAASLYADLVADGDIRVHPEVRTRMVNDIDSSVNIIRDYVADIHAMREDEDKIIDLNAYRKNKESHGGDDAA